MFSMFARRVAHNMFSMFACCGAYGQLSMFARVIDLTLSIDQVGEVDPCCMP